MCQSPGNMSMKTQVNVVNSLRQTSRKTKHFKIYGMKYKKCVLEFYIP